MADEKQDKIDEALAEAAPKLESADEAKVDDRGPLTKQDIIKFVVLVILLAGSVAITIYLWPYIKELSSVEGRQHLIETVTNAGPWGVLVLLALQLIQVIIAAIPGEVVQIVAGILYGPFFGVIIILGGALLSTMFVYWLVQKLGTPFVSKIVPEGTREKLDFITRTSKIDIIVFIVFLIPGIPKDFVTYIISLTDVRPSHFFLFSTIGRVPGVIASVYIGSSFAEGNWVVLVVFVAIALAILGVCLWKREAIMKKLHDFSLKHGKHSEEGAKTDETDSE
ncbi:MAG: TVP38/TMEM64 family protein [bacterium]|nr:TVP38/TMEM64 family protein [bacterium]